MSQNPLLNIRLFERHAEVMRPGSTLGKQVGLKELVQVLTESAENVLAYSRNESLRLPANAYLTVYAGNLLNICCYYPEREEVLTHGGRKYTVMVPNIVIHFTLKALNNGTDYEVKSTHYYSTPKDVNELPNTLPGRLPGIFNYVPFPNFYDNFTMCFGGNSLLHKTNGTDLRMLLMFYQVIAGSPFNDDLGVRALNDSMRPSEWFRHLAEYYKEHKAFPYKDVNY